MSNIFDAVKQRVGIGDLAEDLNCDLKYNNGTRGTHGKTGVFHDHEKSDNEFVINETNGTFYCHKCQFGGDIFTLYANDVLGDKDSRYDAAKALADKYNVEVIKKDWTPEQKKVYEKKQARSLLIQKAIDDSVDFWHVNVDSEYLYSRGINDETITNNKLGFAPNDWKAHYNHMKSQGHDDDVLIESGLFYQKDGFKKLTPSFINRHIIPRFIGERACFITGRTADDAQPKKYNHISLLKHNGDVISNSIYGLDDLGNEAKACVRSRKKEINRPKKRVLIVEGTIDALLAKQEFGDKYIVLSPNTTTIKQADIEVITPLVGLMKPIEVVVCFDADDAGKTGGVNTVFELEKEFVWITEVDDKGKAIGRLLTRKQMDSKVNDAKTNNNPVPKFKKIPMCPVKLSRLPSGDEYPEMDFSDYIAEDMKKDLEYHIDAAVETWRIQAGLEYEPHRFCKDSKSDKVVEKLIMDEMRSEGRTFKAIGFRSSEIGDLYEYNNGVYENNTARIKEDVSISLKELHSPRTVNSSLHTIAQFMSAEPKDFEHPNLINCKNTFIDITDITNPKNVAHTPFIPSLTQYPWTIDKDAVCPNFDTFVSEVVSPDDQDIIFEMIGHCLVQESPFDKMFILYDGGIGGTGKGTFLKILERLIGEDNVSNLKLQDICDDKWAAPQLLGKSANIYADLPSNQLTDPSMIRTITSRDTIEVHAKFKGHIKFKPYATLVFSCNVIPEMRGFSQPEKDRIVIVEFPNRFREVAGKEKNQTTLLADIMPEISGIALKSLQKYKQAVMNGRLSVSDRSNELLGQYQQEQDKVLMFCEDNILVGNIEKDYITLSELGKLFKSQYPKENTSNSAVARRIMEHINSSSGNVITKVGNVGIGRKSVKSLKGVRLSNVEKSVNTDNTDRTPNTDRPPNTKVEEDMSMEEQERQAIQLEHISL